MKFHQTLNQAPRSPNGKHRRPSAPAHRSTADRADNSTGGTDPVTVSWRDFATFTFEKPKPPAIPHAGIRTGEIIGHRLWWVVRNFDGEPSLCSLAHNRIWRPGEIIRGDTNQIVDHDPYMVMLIWGGTYAFSDPAALDLEISEMLVSIEKTKHYRRIGIVVHPLLGQQLGFAKGTIKMWGDVVEHETGYRAEFAKLHSLDRVYSDDETDLGVLRARYLPYSTLTDDLRKGG